MGRFSSARPTSTFILRGPLLLFSSPPAQLLLLAPTHRGHRSASLSGDAHGADWWGPLVSSAVHLGTVALGLFAATTDVAYLAGPRGLRTYLLAPVVGGGLKYTRHPAPS
jgi:hypothetical protein